MKNVQKLYGGLSVGALILGAAQQGAFAQDTDGADADDNLLTFEEIVVFSRSRKESSLSIPQTVDLIDGKILADVNAHTVGDALRFVPGASQDGSKLDAFSDDYLIRGFGSDQTINGATKNRLNHSRDSVNIERVEVLKGPASVLYGQLEPGAVVNVVTKQPEEEFSAEVGFEAGRFDQYRSTLDVTGPLNEAGSVRFRLTAAYEDADAFVDFWGREHIFVAPTLAFDLSEDTTFTIEALHSENDWDAFYNGVPVEGTILPNVNGEIPRERHLADPSLDGTVRKTTDITARLDHMFNDDVSLRAVATWTKGKQDYEEVFGVLGWFPVGPSEAELTRAITRALLAADSESETYTTHLDLSFSLNTGSVVHDVVVGADYSSQNREITNRADIIAPLDVFTPTYSVNDRPAVFVPGVVDSFDDTETKQFGVFLQDRVTVTDNLNLIGGLRYSRVEQDKDFTDFGAVLPLQSQTDTAWTSQIGVLYTPTDDVSLFASRTTSFLAVIGSSFGGAALDPERGTQYEVGVKGKFADGKVSATLAGFHITRSDVAVADRDNPGFSLTVGEQVSKGIEVSLRAKPNQYLDLYAAYAYTDSEVTEDEPARLGKPFRNVPKHTLAFNATYDLSEHVLEGLSLGVNANYVGKRSGDLENTFDVPSYWRVDTSASYALTENVDLRVSVENLFNEEYFSHGFSLFEVWRAAPRTWRTGIKMRF